MDLESSQNFLKKNLRSVIQKKIKHCSYSIQILKLACEGHFEKMQQYLREQSVNGKAFSKSINIIRLVATLFGDYYKYKSSANIDIGNTFLDFLTEVLQGPCKQNQRAICKTKILQNLEDIMFDITDRDYKLKIEDLRMACFTKRIVVFLLSIFEGSQDDHVLNQVINFVNPIILLRRLEFIYNNIVRLKPKEIRKLAITNTNQHISQAQKLALLKTALPKRAERTTVMGGGGEDQIDEHHLKHPIAHQPSKEMINSSNAQYASRELEVFSEQTGEDISLEEVEEAIQHFYEEGTQIYILLKTLSSQSKRFYEKYRAAKNDMYEEQFNQADKLYKAIQFYRENSARIEIVNSQNELQVLYFTKPSFSRYLSQTTVDEFISNVNRETANDKINGLIDKQQDFINEMQHFQFLMKNIKLDIDFWYKTTRYVVMLIYILINILILFDDLDATCEQCVVSTLETPCVCSKPESSTKFHMVIKVIGIICLTLNILAFLLWSILRLKLDVRKSENMFEDYIRQKKKKSQLLLKSSKTKQRKKESVEDFQTDILKYMNFQENLLYYLYVIRHMLFRSYFIYLILCFTVTLVALTYSRIFYCFLLLDIIDRSQILRNVIRSITQNSTQLIMTGILAVTVIYIYSMIAFYNPDLHSTLILDGYTDQNVTPVCSYPWECFLFIVNAGLRQGGGVGDLLTHQDYNDDNKSEYFARFFYDLTFFLIIIIILLNIVFGIIIDTFAELRDQKTNRDSDHKNKCFICNIDRTRFVKEGIQFEKHITKDHMLWNYLFYILYLKEKDDIDYNGTESYIAEKLINSDISWFPINQAMALESREEQSMEEQQTLILNKISQLEQNVKKIQQTQQ